MGKVQHIVFKNGHWGVKKEGGGSLQIFPNKRLAIDTARKDSQADIVIHGRDGQIFVQTKLKGTLDDAKIRQVVRSISGKLVSSVKK
jgi:hypothetical protein